MLRKKESRKDVHLMNRYELLEEIGKIKSEDRTEEYYATIERLKEENKKLADRVDILGQMVLIAARHFDILGQNPGQEIYLDIADDLRMEKIR